ncbi:MAG: tRNA dihydrouridine synthase DusB [Clostridia bacterium]
MKIGKFNFEKGLFLAPMAGVSDIGFRNACKKFGAELTCTEMISANGLLHNSEKTKNLLYCSSLEVPKAVQIFGSDPKVMEKACMHPLLKDFDIIDINMGCPAPKIVKNGEGSALMKNLQKAEEIVSVCVIAADKRPVTVKFRKGINEENVNCVEFAKMCERAGASAIAIHGRTAKQMYCGNVDYDSIERVKNAVSIPVIGNGDVFDRQSYERMLKTSVDGVMLARGTLGKPWLFSSLFDNNMQINRVEIVKNHIDILKQFYDEKWITLYMRKHLLWYLKDVDGANEAKRRIVSSETIDDAFMLFCEAVKNGGGKQK